MALIALVMAAYLLWARPYQLKWGATDQEVKQAMPGDQLAAHPEFFATRAITISGTPEEIWPWLIQIGYCRAWYYGYDILENLGSPRGIRSAERILPEFQQFKVGDEVPISSVAKMVFYAIEPNRYIIWTGTDHQGSFLWALYPIDESHTRLVTIFTSLRTQVDNPIGGFDNLLIVFNYNYCASGIYNTVLISLLQARVT